MLNDTTFTTILDRRDSTKQQRDIKSLVQFVDYYVEQVAEPLRDRLRVTEDTVKQLRDQYRLALAGNVELARELVRARNSL